QHLLSPQRAPERFLQIARENLDTLVTEMDELLTRVSSYINIFWSPAAANEDAIKLNETLRTQDKTLEKSLPELQSEAEGMVIEMRNRELSMQEKIAQDELKNAEDLLDKVKKLFGEPSEKNEGLKNEVRDKLA
ncbi:LAMA2 protein, partial [Chaetops frenatus]|nr:LAMA2 protein [Chaetops frenatus]